METFRFKKLDVWQLGRNLVKDIYIVTKSFPQDERYALIDQLRRAAVSVPSNIAESSARRSTADFIHFLSMARGSLAEIYTQIILAKDLSYVEDISRFELAVEELGLKLNALIASLKARDL
jgi:four helix bundle protein